MVCENQNNEMKHDFLEQLSISMARHEEEKAKKTVAVKVWIDKTTFMIVWMTPEEAARHRKLTDRKGQTSVVRNVLDKGGRLQ